MDYLEPYEVARTPIPLLPDETLLVVPPSVREDLRCRICCSIMKEAKALRGCLHRFCKDCGETALRKSSESKTMKRTGAQCPLCRTNISSKRDLYEDPLFHSLVNLLYPHVAADEESDCLAMAARERAYQDAYVRGEIKAQRGGNVLGLPPSPPPSASPSCSSTPPSQASASDAPFFSPSPSVGVSPPPSPFVPAPPTASTDTEGSLPGGVTLGKRKMGQGLEEKSVAPVSPSESHFQICFVLLPLEPFSPSLPPSLRLPFLNAPPAAPPRLVRTTANATVRSIKIFVAARLQLESAAFLDLSVWVHCSLPFLKASPSQSSSSSFSPLQVREEGDGGRESQRNLGQGTIKKVEAGAPQVKETDGGKTRNGSVKGKDSDLMTEGKRQGRRVILDDALTLGDVIEYFWSLNVSEELCLYYTVRTQGMAGRFW